MKGLAETSYNSASTSEEVPSSSLRTTKPQAHSTSFRTSSVSAVHLPKLNADDDPRRWHHVRKPSLQSPLQAPPTRDQVHIANFFSSTAYRHVRPSSATSAWNAVATNLPDHALDCTRRVIVTSQGELRCIHSRFKSYDGCAPTSVRMSPRVPRTALSAAALPASTIPAIRSVPTTSTHVPRPDHLVSSDTPRTIGVLKEHRNTTDRYSRCAGAQNWPRRQVASGMA